MYARDLILYTDSREQLLQCTSCRH